MKYLTLLTAAYVGGVLRHPHEGAIPVADEEAKQLLDNKAAEDVTDGFTAAQLKAATLEPVAAPGGAAPAEAPANPHQAEAPATTDKPAGRKAAAEKE